MTKPLSSLIDQRNLAVFFLNQKANIPPQKPQIPSTPFFSIPTASRVQTIYYTHKEGLEESFSSPLGQFFSYVLQGVSKTVKKLLSERRPYDTSFIVPPRELLVSRLPEPAFETTQPPRLFLTSSHPLVLDEYTGPCLLQETLPEHPQRVEEEKKILSFVKGAMPQKGILKQDPVSGLIYLYIGPNAEYVEKMLPHLFKNGLPSYFTENYSSHPLGVHFPVFLPSESARAKNLGIRSELGKEFSFTVTGCYSVDTHSHTSLEKAWYLNIESTSLENLREHYLLSPMIASHNFHATLLMKKREPQKKAEPQTFRLNVSCYAA